MNPEVRYTRRRYGTTTYTWAEVNINGRWVSLGDPYPAINWPKKLLADEIARVTTAT